MTAGARFRAVLIANRGEIACRIIRSARSLGYRTVAVYSDADVDALHVRMADVATRIGAAPAGESYLRIENILTAAQRTGADAVHPGYGFLSENDAFARACVDAGLVFIGPPAEAIRLMGNKALAKRLIAAADVPAIPGWHGEDDAPSDDATLIQAAEQVGYPLLIKAAAGGGGRGMRLVSSREGLLTSVRAARAEAVSSFDNGQLLLERALRDARHVEVQVLADSHGNVVFLGERDCSVQRRHQKVIEEAPSPAVDAPLRARMGAAAVAVAQKIGYVGAGTVEFLLDARGNFYFLEMNTRLQVEHPVTEFVTGLDLVALQLRIAAGERLPFAQKDVVIHGHAMEARLYAEDAYAGFLPQVGTVRRWIPGIAGSGEGRVTDGQRIDHGLVEGQEVSPWYDPMLAKLVAWGETREVARRRLARLLAETALLGVTTNKAFISTVIGHPAFAAGEATTAFIGDHLCRPGAEVPSREPLPAWVSATAAVLLSFEGDELPSTPTFSSNGQASWSLQLGDGGDGAERATVRVLDHLRFAVSLGDEPPVEIALRDGGTRGER
ncbi:MAG TPA: biotin carboxylase N-terminal domain-containing protein, partial [Polyangia bacterium]|nr:biotin carboxylase N-terminal domain-containing protein [Polyangia bacterium]